MRGALVTVVQTCARPISTFCHAATAFASFQIYSQTLQSLCQGFVFRILFFAFAPNASCFIGTLSGPEDLAQMRRHIGSGQLPVRALQILDGRFIVARAKQIPADAIQRSEEHTSELPSLMRISYAVFCLNK